MNYTLNWCLFPERLLSKITFRKYHFLHHPLFLIIPFHVYAIFYHVRFFSSFELFVLQSCTSISLLLNFYPVFVCVRQVVNLERSDRLTSLKNPNSAVSTIEPSSESSPLHKGPAQRLPISHRGDHVLRPICQPHPLTRIGFFPVIVPYGSKSSEKKKKICMLCSFGKGQDCFICTDRRLTWKKRERKQRLKNRKSLCEDKKVWYKFSLVWHDT
jgi:hypothetical protein